MAGRSNDKRWVPVFLLAMALVIRSIQATSVPVIGDQLSSLSEAQHLGTNLQGMPYFVLLHFWMELGNPSSALWARLPSIVIGALSVPVIWLWLYTVRGHFVAYVTSILMLLSPLAVEYSQEIRYYSLYLLSALIFFWAYWGVGVARRRDKIWLLGFAFAGSLLVMSHLLGVLIVGLVASHWLFVQRHIVPSWARWLLLLLIIGAGIGASTIFLRPNVVEPVYAAFSRFIASGARTYEGPRGWGVATFAKSALLYHFLVFGQFVYPFTFSISLPGLLLVALFCVLGVRRLLRTGQVEAVSFMGIVGVGSALIVYLFLDPLLPASFADSASPKFVLPLLPLLLWLCAEGVSIMSNGGVRTIAIVALVLVQGIGLYSLYKANWSYSGKEGCCWEEAKTAISKVESQGLVVLAEGRSAGSAEYYFGDVATILNAWSLMNAKQTLAPLEAHTVFVSSDYREKNRCDLGGILSEFAQYRERFAFVKYPLFIYGYDPSGQPLGNQEVLIAPLPHSLYGLEFQDLRLPQTVNWKKHPVKVTGMFTLPTCDGARRIHINDMRLAWPREVSSLLFLSNLTDATDLPDGTRIGKVTVVLQDGTRIDFDLQKGYQTQAWDEKCIQECWSALKWNKKVAFVSNSSEYYVDAYRDFDAQIWATEFEFPQPTTIETIEIRLDDPSATLHIWGLYGRSAQ